MKNEQIITTNFPSGEKVVTKKIFLKPGNNEIISPDGKTKFNLIHEVNDPNYNHYALIDNNGMFMVHTQAKKKK